LNFAFIFYIALTLPSCPLFPYTTLFRSVDYLAQPASLLLPWPPVNPLAIVHDIASLPPVVLYLVILFWLVFESAGTPLPNEAILDRKSTRLNSSHLVISYAVFCLQKKIT